MTRVGRVFLFSPPHLLSLVAVALADRMAALLGDPGNGPSSTSYSRPVMAPSPVLPARRVHTVGEFEQACPVVGMEVTTRLSVLSVSGKAP